MTKSLREYAVQLLRAGDVDEAERQLRELLASEAEECAELLTFGDLCEIHSSLLDRAAEYRSAS